MNEGEFRDLYTYEGTTEAVRSAIDDAEREVFLATPAEAVDSVIDQLAAAKSRGLLVVLLLTGDRGMPPERPLEEAATVARRWTDSGVEDVVTLGTVDDDVGFVTPTDLLIPGKSDETDGGRDRGVICSEPYWNDMIGSTFIGNLWGAGEEAHLDDPKPLPHTFESFHHAVVQSTIHLRAGTELEATLSVRPTDEDDGSWEELECRIVNIRQSFVYPATSSFPRESAMAAETDSGQTVTVGAEGAFKEDYVAKLVTLRDQDE